MTRHLATFNSTHWRISISALVPTLLGITCRHGWPVGLDCTSSRILSFFERKERNLPTPCQSLRRSRVLPVFLDSPADYLPLWVVPLPRAINSGALLSLFFFTGFTIKSRITTVPPLPNENLEEAGFPQPGCVAPENMSVERKKIETCWD